MYIYIYIHNIDTLYIYIYLSIYPGFKSGTCGGAPNLGSVYGTYKENTWDLREGSIPECLGKPFGVRLSELGNHADIGIHSLSLSLSLSIYIYIYVGIHY